jgi:mitogen-activated protein kinase 1/3
MHRVIRTQDLSGDHCQYFNYHSLPALKAMHSATLVLLVRLLPKKITPVS